MGEGGEWRMINEECVDITQFKIYNLKFNFYNLKICYLFLN